MMLNELAKQIHENAKEKGWHDSFVTFGETIALCHAELSEALEEYRNNKPLIYFNVAPDRICVDMSLLDGRKPEGMAVEMIDCLIRILDWCAKKEIDIEQVIKMKHEFNTTRSFRHGNKVI